MSGCALLYRYSKDHRLLSEWLCTSVQIQQRIPPLQWVVVHFCTDTANKTASSVSGCVVHFRTDTVMITTSSVSGSSLLYRYYTAKNSFSSANSLFTSVQIQQKIPPPQRVVLHFCTDTAKNTASSASGSSLLYRYSKEYRLLCEWLCTSVQIQQRNTPPQWVVVHFCTDTVNITASSVSGCALLYRYSKYYRLLSEWFALLYTYSKE